MAEVARSWFKADQQTDPLRVYRGAIKGYSIVLEGFVNKHPVLKDYLHQPDHIAFKAADAAHYQKLVKDFEPVSDYISEIQERGRRLATARLTGPIAVRGFGEVSWVELMEPRPEKLGQDVVGIEHMEFTQPDGLQPAREALRAAGVNHKTQAGGRTWLNIVLNGVGQELKFNDRLLGLGVEEEIARGEAEIIFSRN